MKMSTILVFVLSVFLLGCFSADAALTHQKVQKMRGSMKLASRSHTKNDDGDEDDDDDDDDEDDAPKEDPAKARMTKELKENRAEQTALKKSLRHLNDESKSDEEIDGYAKLVANETQSPAMSTMLATMWKDMRMFEVPEYTEHVDEQLAHLKKEEQSTEHELAATVTISKAGNTYGSEGCPCIGVDNLEGETMAVISKGKKASYPADLGARCEAWDFKDHPKCPGADWCEQKWCYVDPCNCNIPVLPKPASYIPGAQYQGKALFFSYATCGGKDSYTGQENKKDKKTAKLIEETCAAEVKEEKWGEGDCQCIGVGPQPGTTKVNIKGKMVDFPADTGATCKAWEEDNHPDCQGDDAPEWCNKEWCYVDPCKCKLATPPKTSSYLPDGKYQGKPVYYSYETCGAKDAFSAGDKKACVNQKTSDDCAGLDDKCAWSGKECLGKELVTVCQDEKKPKALAVAPAPVIKSYGDEGCPCVGVDNLEGETMALVKKGEKKESYPADLGARCEAWDLSDHPKCPGEGWCEQKWCYVDPCNCNIPVLPKPASYIPGAEYQGKPLFFSYATCGGKDSYTGKENKKDGKTAKLIEKTCAVDVDAKKWGEEDCRCVGVGPQPGTTKVNIKGKMVDFPADTGATCTAWEQDNHPDCQGDEAPDWCSKAWCYVDPCKCKLATPPKTSSYLPDGNYQGKPVYYSYATCGSDDSYSAGDKKACVNQKTSDDCSKFDKCAWDGKQCLGKELVSVCGTDAHMKGHRSAAYGMKGFMAFFLALLACIQA